MTLMNEEPHWVSFLDLALEHAYMMGLHEIGYDPMKELRAALKELDSLKQSQATHNESTDGGEDA